MHECEVAGVCVSRETLGKLRRYEELLKKWSSRINLVSRADLKELWARHIVDSAQLYQLADLGNRWLDLGSGGGFPGIVIAIMKSEHQLGPVTLVESDKRKCAFLRTVGRTLDLNLDVRSQRIEHLQYNEASTLSARALAPLETLASYASRFLGKDGIALFPKGRNWRDELDAAQQKWSFDCDVIQSVSDPEAAILRLRNIERT